MFLHACKCIRRKLLQILDSFRHPATALSSDPTQGGAAQQRGIRKAASSSSVTQHGEIMIVGVKIPADTGGSWAPHHHPTLFLDAPSRPFQMRPVKEMNYRVG